MKVKEIMERTGMKSTGAALAYIKDALEDMNTISETHFRTIQLNVNSNQRFYDIPKESVKILDIRCKHHNNEDSKYRSIP